MKRSRAGMLVMKVAMKNQPKIRPVLRISNLVSPHHLYGLDTPYVT
jgi:hypothetical protein